jgi:hypothetical protein
MATILSGNTTFNNLSVTTPLKTLRFTAGSTQVVTGTLTMTGSLGNLITLESTSAGNAWTFSPSSSQSVDYVSVRDSDIGSATGVTITANLSTNVSGNDTDDGGDGDGAWFFASVTTHTWDGSSSTDWNTPANWDSNVVPSVGHDIVIPDVTNDPILPAGGVTVGDLTIQTGGLLTTNGEALTINGDLSLGGTLSAGASTITVIGDWTVDPAGVFAAGTSTVVFSGSLAQTLESGGDSFANLTVDKGAGTVTAATDRVAVSGALTVAAGTLDTAANAIALTCGSLAVSGTLSSGTGPVTVNGNAGGSGSWTISGTNGVTAASVAGAFSVSNLTLASGDLVMAGNATFTGVTAAAGSTVRFAGSSAQAVVPNGQSFGIVDVTNTDAVSGVTLSGVATFASLTVGASSIFGLDGSSATTVLNIASGGSVANSGVFRIVDSTNAVRLRASSGTFSFTGTDIDYNGHTIHLGGLSSYAPAVSLGAGEGIVLDGTCAFASSITLNGNASTSFIVGASSLTAGNIDVQFGTLSLDDGAAVSCAALSSTATDGTIANPISGATAITASGSVSIAGPFSNASVNTLTTNADATSLSASVSLGNLAIDPGAGNTVTLSAGLTLSGSLTVATGIFDALTNNASVSCASLSVLGTLRSGTGAVTVTGNAAGTGAWEITGTNGDIGADIGGNFSVSSLTLTSGDLAIAGDATFASLSAAAASTVVFDGAAVQNLIPAAQTFGNVEVSNTAAALTMTGTATFASLSVADSAVFALDGTSAPATLNIASGGSVATNSSGTFRVTDSTTSSL